MPDGLTTGHSVDLFAPAHSPPAHADLTVHVTASPLAPFWQRPTDSRTPVRSPATLAGLTIYPTASQHVVFSARVGVATKTKSPLAFSQRAFCSGDVLLSHGLSPYYHRGCSVSLPCSEWERVGPLRDSHQKPAPKYEAGFWCVIRNWLHRYHRGFALRNFATVLTFFNVSRFKFQRTARFSDIYIQEVKVDVKASFCF